MDKLGIYNEALRLVGERRLASLTEDREPRRMLDSAWAFHAYDTWLEEADWQFAMSFVKIEPNTSITTVFGYENAFDQPTDMVRVSGVWADEYQEDPLREYRDEGGKWYSDREELYVGYVSNSSTLGGNVGNWPNTFALYVAAYLAHQIAPRLKNDVSEDKLKKALKEAKTNAMSKDALKNPSREAPQGTWTRARGGRNYNNLGIPD